MLVAGFAATSILFAGMTTSAGVAEEIEQGSFDRLRSLPIPRSSVLLGRVLADTGLLAWALAVTIVIAFAVGFHLHGSAVAGPTAFGLCVRYGFALSWLFITIGLVGGSAQATRAFRCSCSH